MASEAQRKVWRERKSKYLKDNPAALSKVRKSNKAWLREWYKTTEGRVAYMLQRAQIRAKKNGLAFDLDREWLLELWNTQNGCCALTGLPFDLSTDPDGKGKSRIAPQSPSLDKIDASLGYTKNNVRLVCSHMNVALSSYGIEAFERLCEAYARRKRETDSRRA